MLRGVLFISQFPIMFFSHSQNQNNKPKPKPRGKLIVLYGINNLGKTTQAKMLVEKLKQTDIAAEYLKYPLYGLAPSGTLINNYLRQGNFYKLTPREAQIIYTLNRTQYEETLKQKLAQGIFIIAEDYTGTGLAWGIGADVDENFLKFINSHLLKEDLAILFDGSRFTSGIETNHRHEQNEELTNKVRVTHLHLAQERDWQIINANQTIEQVQAAVWKKVKKILPADETADINNLIAKAYPAEENKVEITAINPIISDVKNINMNPRLLGPEEKEERSCAQFNFTSTINSTIEVQKLTPDAKPPTRAHASDAGLDLYANDTYTLYENEVAAIATGIALAIPENCVGLIWDKSGLAAGGLKTMGGVIDSGYCGEIKVVVINLSGDIYNIAKGQKIAQILIQEIKKPELREVGRLTETERGERGFGSTGI
jgi:dUTP pyrophosphatase